MSNSTHNSNAQANPDDQETRKTYSSNSTGEEMFGVSKYAIYAAVGFVALGYYIAIWELPQYGLLFRLLGFVGFFATLILAWSTRRGLPVSTRFARLMKRFTRRRTLLSTRKGSKKKQIDDISWLGRLVRLPGLRNIKVIGQDPEDDRPQASVSASEPIEGSPAIKTEEGHVIGNISINPAAMAVPSDDMWNRRMDDLADVIETSVQYHTELVNKTRAVDYTPRCDLYDQRERQYLSNLAMKHGSLENAYSKVGPTMEDSDIDREDLSWMLSADLCDERQEVINMYEATTLKKEFFAAARITPKDVVTPAHVDEDSGGLHRVPLIGRAWKRYRLWDMRRNGDHIPEMVDRLESYLDELEQELRQIPGITPRVMSSTEYSQVLADHFRAANVYANADFKDQVRLAPKPKGGDSLYGVSYDHLRELPDQPLGGGGPSPEAPTAGSVGSTPSAAGAATDGGTMARPERTAEAPSDTGKETENDHEKSYFEQVQEINDYPIADLVRTPEELKDHYQGLISANNTYVDDNDWLVIDRAAYSKTFSIRNWPAVPPKGILEPIIRSHEPGVAVNSAIHITPQDQNQASTQIDAAVEAQEKNVESSTFDKSKFNIRAIFDVFRDKYKKQLSDAKQMEQAVEESEYDLFKNNTHFELRSDDPEAINRVHQQLRSDLDHLGARIESEDEYHKEGYESVSPAVQDKLEEPIWMFADGIARQFSWTSRNLTESSGVEFGINMHSSAPLYLDFLNRQSGYDFGIFGPKGNGKTTTAKKILKGLELVYGDDIFIGMIDPLHEFEGMSIMSNGDHIVVGGPRGINPFHMEPTPEEKIGLLEDDPYTQWRKKCMDFIELYYEVEGLDISGKKGVWRKAIRLAGEKYGITGEPETHDPENRAKRQEAFYTAEDMAVAYLTDGEQLATMDRDDIPDDVPSPLVDPTDCPTVVTAIDIIDQMAEDGSDYVRTRKGKEPNPAKVKEREKKAISIVNNDIEPFLGDGEYSHFAKQMQIDFENVGSVYCDMQRQDNDKAVGLTMMVLYDMLYEHIKTIDKPGVVFIDEHHKMLRDENLTESINMKVRAGRHFDMIHGVSTQSVKDYFTDSQDSLTDTAQTVFDNMPVRIYQQDDLNTEWYESLSLTNEEGQFISDAMPGNAERGFSTALLWVKDQGSFPLKVKMDRIGGNPENPREAIFVDYDRASHGPDMLEYLLEHNDVCDWRFAPPSATPGRTAEGGA